MLAQNFLTASELDLHTEERDTLVTLLGMMERGEIRDLPSNSNHSWVRRERWAHGPPDYSDLAFFYMGTIAREYTCGAAGCMLGWARKISGNQGLFRESSLSDHENVEIFYLFGFAPIAPTGALCANISQSTAALRSYLTTGNARWDLVL